MARTPDPKLHALWRDRVRRQGDSGLTVAQFCAQEGLSAKAFYGWKRRVQPVGYPDERPALPAQRTFLPATVRVVDRACEELTSIEADLPNGIRLRIPTANTQLACQLVRAVAGARTKPGGPR